jgi:polysaccharide deacetylase 2 family uncharacterized protein YibQ
MKFAIPGLDKLMRRKKGGDEDEDYEEEVEDEADIDEGEDSSEEKPPPAGKPAPEEEPEDSADDDTEVVPKAIARRPSDDDEEDEEDDERWQDADEGNRAKAFLAGLLAFPRTMGARFVEFAGEGRRRILVLGGAGFFVLLLLAVIGFLIFGGGEAPPPPPAAEAGKAGTAVEAPPPPRFGPGDTQGEAPAPPPAGAPPQASAPPPGGTEASPAPVEASPPPPPTSAITGLITPSVPADAFARLPELAAGEKPLVAQADPALLEKTPSGSLPKAGPGGRLPLQAYARPVNPNDDRPRIAVIVKGVGLAPATTDAAIRRLPGAVTLALDPNGHDLDAVAMAARSAGHEVLMTLPLASETFPIRDPGPFALPIVQTPAENLARLRTIMGAASGYVGLLSHMGGTLLGRDDQIRPILLELKNRGLMFVDGGGTAKSLAPAIATEIGLPRAIVKIVLDEDPSRAAIDAKLAEAEKLARSSAATVAIASAYPVTLERLGRWAATLDGKQLSLMPITALADRQFE